MTYELPDGTQFKAKRYGRLTARAIVDGRTFDFGPTPFHFIDDPKWTPLLFGRPTLARHNITPEQAIQHLQQVPQDKKPAQA